MKSLLLILALTTFFGCQSDPYPEGDLTKNPPVVTNVEPGSIDVPVLMEFKEGDSGVYQLGFVFPPPGEPIVEVENLPTGASFDAKTFILSWTPDFNAGSIASDPSVNRREYKIKFMVRNSAEPTTGESREAILIVYNTPREFSIDNHSRYYTYKEGETKEFSLDIKNEDYPEGPFNIEVDNAPTNFRVNKSSRESEILVSYNPPINEVFYKDSGWRCTHPNASSHTGECDITVNIKLTDPSGRSIQVGRRLDIMDARQDVFISAIDEVEFGSSGSLQIIANDTNLEMPPRITLLNAPEFGEVKTSYRVKDFTSFFTFDLKEIPLSRINTDYKLQFKVCVNGDRGREECVNKDILVSFKIKDRNPPVIVRSNWEVSKIKYLEFNQNSNYYIPVRDGDTGKAINNVKIMPESMRQYVKWVGNSLEVKMNKSGIFSFNLIATSEYKLQSAESFLFEVLPKDRSKYLLLSEKTRGPETRFYRQAFKNLDVVNPLLTELGERDLIHRDTLILGTSLLEEKIQDPKLTSSIMNFKNIVIASPKIENLPEELISELTRSYGVRLIGHVESETDFPGLDKLFFDYKRQIGLQDPVDLNKRPYLKGISSAASHDPYRFAIGVGASGCDDILELDTYPRPLTSAYVVGIHCKRSNNGRILLTGFEWADMKADNQDGDLVTQWLNRLIEWQGANK